MTTKSEARYAIRPFHVSIPETALADLRPVLQQEGVVLHARLFRPANFVTAAINGRQGSQTGNEVRETITRLDNSSKSLQSALEHIDHVSDRLDRGEGTLGRLSKDETLINEVQSAAEGINAFMERREPAFVGH